MFKDLLNTVLHYLPWHSLQLTETLLVHHVYNYGAQLHDIFAHISFILNALPCSEMVSLFVYMQLFHELENIDSHLQPHRTVAFSCVCGKVMDI